MTTYDTNQIEQKYLETYAFADLGAGKDAKRKNNKRQARQVIVVGCRDWLDRWFFPFIWAGKETTSDFKKKILDTQEQFSPRMFGLEANGMQVLFGSLVREEAKIRFGTVKMVPVYQPTNVDKDYRIRTGLEPMILQGRLFLLPESTEAWIELRGFPTAMTKDIVDAIETCIRMAPKRPINVRSNVEYESYARYLRSTKTPPYIIEQKLAEFRRSLKPSDE